MRKSKSQKGITLIALIITIIVLLILAVVTIGAVQEDGIIGKAKYARDEYEKAQAKENSILQGYLDKLNENGGNSEGDGGRINITPDTTMEDAQDDNMLTKTVNSNVVDKYQNPIIIPAGFKILVDDTTGYTADTIDVTKGIVIEDASGNQFVWVPVGNIYYSETEYKTIILGRYSNFTANANGEYVPAQKAEDYATVVAIDSYYTEDTVENHNSTYDNAIEKDIGAFVESVTTKGGYYLGRYEAGDGVTTSARTSSTSDINTMVCKAGQYVYNYVTQAQASSLSQSMYTSSNFTSDLVNSYAWDTAVVFIQIFSNDSNYANSNYCTSFANTGINADKYCNIYDMSGNAFEWTTETSYYGGFPCVVRGGSYDSSYDEPYNYTGGRYWSRSGDNYNELGSFRPILYVAL